MMGNYHVRCGPGEKLEIISNAYLSVFYAFRNATPENLVAFDKYFPSMVDINMEDNFRSMTPIVSMANKLVEQESRLKTVIKAHKLGHGQPPALMQLEPDQEQNIFIRQVKKLIAEGTPPSDIAILCRTRAELVALRDALNAAGVPVILRVPEVMGDNPYVKAVIALASWLRDDTDLLSLSLYAKSIGIDPFDQMQVVNLGAVISKNMEERKKDSEKQEYFYSLLTDACGDFIANTFVDELKGKKFKTLAATLSYCVKYRRYGTKTLLSTAKENADCVTLITVHSAKGLEWPVVLLSLKKFHPKDQEERRLLYVAITRAKEKLLISYSKKTADLAALLA